jgi:hypothetical protein
MAKIKEKIYPKVRREKGLTVIQCWLAQGQEPDEKMQPIL